MRYIAKFVVVAICVLAQTPSGAFGQGQENQGGIEDGIRKAWKERSDKIESFECKCSLTRTDSPEAASDVFSKQKPQGPVELKQPFTLIKKGKKLWMQSKGEQWNNETQSPMNQTYTRCFNGKMNKALLEGDTYRFPAAQANIDRQPAEELIKNTHYTPLWLSFSAGDMLNRLNFKTSAMSANGKQCQGKPCVEIKMSRDGVESYVYVDPTRANVPVRFVEMRGQKEVRSETTIQYDKNEVVGWVLSSWISKLYGGNGEVETTVVGKMEKVEINGLIKDEVFDIPFPVGTRIRETINGVTKFYIQEADGKRQETIRGGT